MWSYSVGDYKIYIQRNCSSLYIWIWKWIQNLLFKPQPMYVKVPKVLCTPSKTRMKFFRFALLCQVTVAYVLTEILQLKIISVLRSIRFSWEQVLLAFGLLLGKREGCVTFLSFVLKHQSHLRLWTISAWLAWYNWRTYWDVVCIFEFFLLLN